MLSLIENELQQEKKENQIEKDYQYQQEQQQITITSSPFTTHVIQSQNNDYTNWEYYSSDIIHILSTIDYIMSPSLDLPYH